MKITKAWSFIEKDSINGRLTKCKLLGKLMNNAPDSDVAEYLYVLTVAGGQAVQEG